MDKISWNLDMTHYASSGRFLNLEEQLLLKMSLPLLRKENDFSSVAFWGKIFGREKDYYVVQGRGKDYIRNKMSFYSLDGQVWRILFPPRSEDLQKFHLVRSEFTGDPTEHHKFCDPAIYSNEPDVKGVMKEEDRLSAVVYLVDAATAIAPLGAFALSHSGRVVRNETFSGLSRTEGTKLSSYGHLRLPGTEDNYAPKIPPYPPGGDRAMDFLEPISRDITPAGWTLKLDESVNVVTISNLWWPGFTFYHQLNTSKFGSIYMGYGIRNDDLPFMVL